MARLGDKLSNCQGYVVIDTRGRQVGRVKWIRYDSDAACPDGLVIVGRRWLRRSTFEIPTSRVTEVDPDTRVVMIAD